MATNPKSAGEIRGQHVGRTPRQRREYIENVVEGAGPSSTTPMPVERQGESTVSPLTSENDLVTRQPSRRRQSPRKSTWLETHRGDLGKAFIGFIFTGILGTAFTVAITNNREVGEVQQSLKGT